LKWTSAELFDTMELYTHTTPLLQRAKTTASYGYLLKPVFRLELAATIASFFFANGGRIGANREWSLTSNSAWPDNGGIK